jgi:hypothetical protein
MFAMAAKVPVNESVHLQTKLVRIINYFVPNCALMIEKYTNCFIFKYFLEVIFLKQFMLFLFS